MADNSSNIFGIGFIAGALAGVVIGLLYAPGPGKETRARLREKAGELRDVASERFEKAREAAADAQKKVREKLGE